MYNERKKEGREKCRRTLRIFVLLIILSQRMGLTNRIMKSGNCACINPHFY